MRGERARPREIERERESEGERKRLREKRIVKDREKIERETARGRDKNVKMFWSRPFHRDLKVAFRI